MEFFVDMTTHVPDGTLWRPPSAPGVWRSFGVFAADGDTHLESLLSSMPLRVWRTDEVTPLVTHPNDPGAVSGRVPSEFLTDLAVTVPEGAPTSLVDDLYAREAVRTRELAEQGHLLRLWRLPRSTGTRRRPVFTCRRAWTPGRPSSATGANDRCAWWPCRRGRRPWTSRVRRFAAADPAASSVNDG
jgi:muconolactone delta-isomerase